MDIVRQCDLPTSAVVSAEQAALAMLVLKLIGTERLSHIALMTMSPLRRLCRINRVTQSQLHDDYSCRLSEALLQSFNSSWCGGSRPCIRSFIRVTLSIWIFIPFPIWHRIANGEGVGGARGKAVKGANTLLAQEAASNVILYTRADILRQDEAREIQHFVQYWKTLRHTVKETLVFDCRLTSYTVLNELMADGVLFITLRRRSQGLLQKAARSPTPPGNA